MFGSLFVAAALATIAQPGSRAIWDLWPQGNPGGWSRPDQERTETPADAGFPIVHAVSKPTLEWFPAPKAKKGAPTVLVVPGGGYSIVAIGHEGVEIAEMLNRAGIHAAVLKYRIPVPDRDKVRHLVPLQDAQRALRLLRSKSAELKIDPKKVGMIGFSAGGHLSATTAAAVAPAYPEVDAADKESFRPDFVGLIYPAYLNVEGKIELNEEVRPAKGNAPVWLLQTVDDWIPMEGGMAMAAGCRAAGVPIELHCYPVGGHGYGLRSREPGLKDWHVRFCQWVLQVAG